MLEFVDDRPTPPPHWPPRCAPPATSPTTALATAAFLALRMDRPLFCEGEPGTGKTALAQALATVLDAELIRLQCHDGIDAVTGALRLGLPPPAAAPARAGGDGRGDRLDVDDVEASLYDRTLPARPPDPAGAAEPRRAVLLVDEIDRADDEFEAFLLEVLTEHAVTIPELGEVRAVVPPLVVLTSNRTREVHDALKRRCLYLWLDHPDVAREIEILHARLPGLPERLAAEVATAVHRLREADLLKPPGVAESLDWARALQLVGARQLDVDSAAATLGAVLKYREDADRVRTGSTSLLASCRDRLARSPSDAAVDQPRPRAGLVGFTAVLRARRACPSPPTGSRRSSPPLDELDVTAASRSTGPGWLTLCGDPDDLPRYDAAFVDWFDGAAARRHHGPRQRGRRPRDRPRCCRPGPGTASRTTTSDAARSGRAPRAPRCCATTTSAS